MMRSDDTPELEIEWDTSMPRSDSELREAPLDRPESRRARVRAYRPVSRAEATAEVMRGRGTVPLLPPHTGRELSRQPNVIDVGWVRTGERFLVTERRPPPARSGPSALFAPHSPQAASIRILSHKLKQAGNPQVILVTSARAKEGRTTCALNLAWAFAEDTSAQVMLVEANCMEPALHQALGGPPQDCLADQLKVHRDEPEQPWKVMSALAPNLHVLAMSPTPNARTINASLFGDLVLALREEQYSHVVVDSPPVLGSAEANALAEHSDAILLTAMAGASRSTDLETAAAQLGSRKLMGVVLLNG
jgi:Mrp family chromosome partitioning ATPase